MLRSGGRAGLVRVRQLLVQRRDTRHARHVAVRRGPLPKEGAALGTHVGVRDGVGCHSAQPLKQRLIGKRALEARPGVLDEAVEDG